MKRKIFAALLAVMMVVSMLPLSVMATLVDDTRLNAHFSVYKNGDFTNPVATYAKKIPNGKSVKEECGKKLDQMIAENTGEYGGKVYGWYYGDGDWNQYNAGRSPAGYDLYETERVYKDHLNIRVMIYDLAPVVFYDSFGEGKTELYSAKAEVNKTIGEAGIAIPTPTKEGYTFSHWCGDDPIYNKYDTSEAVKAIKVNGWTNLHAEWTPNTIDLRYIGGVNGNYGYTEDGDWWKIEKVTNDTTSQLDAYTFAREGYTFAGWMDKNGDDVTAPYTVSDTDGNGVERVWAKWTINQYTITFDTAGGSKIDPIKQNYGTAVTAPANPTKEGHTFAGWDVAVPTTMPAGDMTVTAQWTVNQYTITFANTGDTEIAPIKQDYGTAVTAPANPTKEGYTFAGWDVAVPTTMPAGDMTVTAQWKANSYDFTYIVDGDEYTTSYEYGAEVEAPADPTKKGYTFAGWVDEEDNSVEFPFNMPANDVEVTATWTTNAYNLDFDGNSGYVIDPDGNEVEKLTRTIFYGNDFAMPKAVRDGYTFAGWSYTNAEGDEIICAAGDIVNSLASEHGARIALTARWTKNNYTIEFALDGGEISEEECTALQIEDNLMACKYAKDYVLPTPTKTGYTFMGWEFEKDGETVVKLGGETVRNLTTEEGDTVTLTAQWEENLYTLHFDSNGGEAVKTKTLRYNAEYTVPATTRDGYTFLGWECVNRSTKEVVDFFEEGEVITKLTDKHGAHFDLTAQWDVNVYTLHFDSNGGEAVKTKSLRYESEYTIPATTREGYIFLGWECVDRSTKESVGFFEAGTVISKLTDKHGAHFDLTAQWELIEYTLQFNAGKDQGLFENGTRFFRVEKNIEDEAFTLAELLTEEATREGYNLIAWSFGGEKYTPDAKFTVADLLELVGEPEENKFKFTAVWGKNTYTITFANTGDTVIAPITQDYGTAVTAPADPTKTGYTFAGWDKKIPETMPAENLVITAQWTANQYIVKFDANGGAVAEESMVVTYDAKYGEFPEVTRAKADFYGWYTADGVKVTPETIVKIAGNHTLTARWDVPSENRTQRQAGIPKNMRSIEIDTTEGGKTNVASGNAAAVLGSTYKLTVTPDEGFEIAEVLVNGKEAKVNKNGKVSFVVKADTRVEVSFAEIED